MSVCVFLKHQRALQDADVEANSQDAAKQDASEAPLQEPDSAMADAGSAGTEADAADKDAPASTSDAVLDSIATESAPEASQV